MNSAEYAKEWRKKNPDKYKAIQRRYIMGHMEQVRAKKRRSYKKNYARQVEYYKAHKRKYNALQRERNAICSSALLDEYVKRTICNSTRISMSLITSEMIEAKRTSLFLKRMYKNISRRNYD